MRPGTLRRLTFHALERSLFSGNQSPAQRAGARVWPCARPGPHVRGVEPQERLPALPPPAGWEPSRMRGQGKAAPSSTCASALTPRACAPRPLLAGSGHGTEFVRRRAVHGSEGAAKSFFPMAICGRSTGAGIHLGRAASTRDFRTRSSCYRSSWRSGGSERSSHTHSAVTRGAT